jgi:hypothetical protein
MYSSTFFNLRTTLEWVVNAMPRPLYARENPDTHLIRCWVGPTAGVDGCEKSRPTGIRSPDRPGHSQSLYRLRYPGPHIQEMEFNYLSPPSSLTSPSSDPPKPLSPTVQRGENGGTKSKPNPSATLSTTNRGRP